MRRALALSTARGITIDVSLYVALAKEHDNPLVIADTHLIRRLSDDPSLHPRLLFISDLRR